MSDIPPILLPTEYQAALRRIQRIEDRMLWIGIGGGLLSLATATDALINRASLKIGSAWIAPLPFILTAAVLLGLFSSLLAAQALVQALHDQAERTTSQPFLPSYPPILPGLMLLPGIGGLILYLLTLFYSMHAIYAISHSAGTIFGLVYSLLSGAVLIAGIAIWRQKYALNPLTKTELRRVLLPDPADFLLGIGLFTSGFLVPFLTVGLNASQFGVLNALFRRAVDFTDAVPWAAISALGMGYFVVLEGLLIPAGRLWLAQRHEQPLQRSYTQILMRLFLAFPLAYALGGTPLLVLALLIGLHQTVTVVNTDLTQTTSPLRPRQAAARDRFHLIWGGMLPALRFYGGVLVWVGPAWSFTVLLLLFCAVAFLGVAFNAAQHARKARILMIHGGEPSTYHLKNAPRWQRAGFLAAGLTTLGLIVLQILAETNDFFNSYLAVGYGRFNNGAVQYSQAGLVNGLLLSGDLLLFGLLGCALFVRILPTTGQALALWAEHIRSWFIPLLWVCSAGLAIACIFTGLFSLALGSLLAAILAEMIWWER